MTRKGLQPKAVIPVDLFGLPSDYDAIKIIAEENKLIIIEDAAQSFGSEYKGAKACSFGDIACTSFFPAKPLGCFGDGGMCFTNDDTISGALKSIRVHGQGGDKYDNIRIGINGRLDTLQAAILLAKFEIFPTEIECRQTVAMRYADLLKQRSSLIIPTVPRVIGVLGLSILFWRRIRTNGRPLWMVLIGPVFPLLSITRSRYIFRVHFPS